MHNNRQFNSLHTFKSHATNYSSNAICRNSQPLTHNIHTHSTVYHSNRILRIHKRRHQCQRYASLCVCQKHIGWTKWAHPCNNIQLSQCNIQHARNSIFNDFMIYQNKQNRARRCAVLKINLLLIMKCLAAGIERVCDWWDVFDVWNVCQETINRKRNVV